MVNANSLNVIEIGYLDGLISQDELRKNLNEKLQ